MPVGARSTECMPVGARRSGRMLVGRHAGRGNQSGSANTPLDAA
jgi:hypothetical protein